MPAEDDDEVSKLENEVENVLHELSNLEVQFEDVLKPRLRSSAPGAIDTNYLVAVRRFQNGMRVSLLKGAKTGDKQIFQEGFKFYAGALTILRANSDIGEIQQLNNELIQTLIKIIAKGHPTGEEFAPYGPFFLLKSCQHLATIYEISDEFDLAMRFHDRAASFSKGITRELELLQKMLNALLCNKMSIVQETLGLLEIKHIRQMGSLFFQGFTKNDLQRIENAQNLLETLGAQRNIPIKPILNLIEKIVQIVQQQSRVEIEPDLASQVIKLPVPSQSVHLSDNIITELRTVLKEGIQQLRSSQPQSTQEAPVIDTNTIISEIKNVISEEIKTISSEIVSQIVNKLPVGLPSGARARSGGAISDDVPDIKIVAAAPGERAPRPKLDDMLDSIIVSE
ncbi:MAG: hypothetical protein HWN66_02295 [Candidatus Helarchaeota archaeon]|nr:hypothetical protein [Candidatus Helarchaeota archaeon]